MVTVYTEKNKYYLNSFDDINNINSENDGNIILYLALIFNTYNKIYKYNYLFSKTKSNIIKNCSNLVDIRNSILNNNKFNKNFFYIICIQTNLLNYKTDIYFINSSNKEKILNMLYSKKYYLMIIINEDKLNFILYKDFDINKQIKSCKNSLHMFSYNILNTLVNKNSNIILSNFFIYLFEKLNYNISYIIKDFLISNKILFYRFKENILNYHNNKNKKKLDLLHKCTSNNKIDNLYKYNNRTNLNDSNKSLKYIQDCFDILFLYSYPIVEINNFVKNYLDLTLLNIDEEIKKLINSVKNYSISIRFSVLNENCFREIKRPPKILHLSCHGLIKTNGEYYIILDTNGIKKEIAKSQIYSYLSFLIVEEKDNCKSNYFNTCNNIQTEKKYFYNVDNKLTLHKKNISKIKNKSESSHTLNNLLDKKNNIYNKNSSSTYLKYKSPYKNTSKLIDYNGTIIAVLAACYSQNLIDIIFDLGIKVVVCIISSSPVLDNAAIIFTSSFYSYIFEGESVSISFTKAKNDVKNSLNNKDLYPCCCMHPHNKNCLYYRINIEEFHNIHKKNCDCKNLNYNLHYYNCLIGIKIKEKHNSLNNDNNKNFINACCCSPNLNHNEINKFVIYYKEGYNHYAELSMYHKSKKERHYKKKHIFNKNTSKYENCVDSPYKYNSIKKICNISNENLIIHGKQFFNNFDLYIPYVPYMIGRCKDVFEAFYYVYDNSKEINSFVANKRLITFTGNLGVGKSVVCKLTLRYLMERNIIKYVLYVKDDMYSSKEELENLIKDFIKIDIFNTEKINAIDFTKVIIIYLNNI